MNRRSSLSATITVLAVLSALSLADIAAGEEKKDGGLEVNPTSYVLRKLSEYRTGLDNLITWFVRNCGRSPAEPLPLEKEPETWKEPPKWVPFEYELIQVQQQAGNNPFLPQSPLGGTGLYASGSTGTVPTGTGFISYYELFPGLSEAMLQLSPTYQLISGSNSNPGVIWNAGTLSGAPPGFAAAYPVNGATWSNGGTMSNYYLICPTTVYTGNVMAGGVSYRVLFRAESAGVTVTGIYKQ